MTRHARNCTAGSVYTYHEKKKDSAYSGYGSKDMRLGKDSIKEFDCCCLTLQPCRDPVVTPDGYLYDKEAILEYILHKKREIARKLKEFEKQKSKKEKDAEVATSKEAETKLKNFVESESNIVTKKDQPVAGTSAASEDSISNMKNGRNKTLPSFWLPNLTPKAKASSAEKPDEKVRCPMSGKPIKLKDLITVNFKEIKDGDTKKSLIVKDARYVCAVTNDVLGNSVPCAVLRPSGSVVTMECVEKIIKKEMLDPINGAKLREKDIIPLERGATGFSGAGVALKAKKDGPAMQA